MSPNPNPNRTRDFWTFLREPSSPSWLNVSIRQCLVHANRVLAFALLAAIAISPVLAQSPQSAPANGEAELPAGPMQAKATNSCLECHEARIILQQRLTKAAWGREVDKMIKWGALVDAADHDPLIDYLSSNFAPDKPPYQAPTTAPGK